MDTHENGLLGDQVSQPGARPLIAPRSRSSTTGSSKSRHRPLSRASTTSIHSFTNSQPAPDAQFVYQQQQPQQHQQQLHQEAYQYAQDGMLVPTGQHLADPHHFPLDPSLDDPTHGLAYPSGGFAQTGPSHNDLSYSGFTDADGSMLGLGHAGHHQDDSELAGQKKPTEKKKTGNGSAQNDVEYRRLYRENQHKSLQEIAGQLQQLQAQGNERGPQSEKNRQVFAMLWLNVSCKKGTGSVPRGRVYAHYVSRCGSERVSVLNPASFGKLVKVMFPAIQTRRLGMRGESKYHYCGLEILEDQEGLVAEANGNSNMSVGPNSRPGSVFSANHQLLPADTAMFPSPSLSTGPSRHGHRRHARATSSLFCGVQAAGRDALNSSTMIVRELRFPSTPEEAFRDNEPINLPAINLYLPAGTDEDTAAALTALYRSNCTSLIDCVRFCRDKAFFHFFTSFHGTLTVPVQKLLINPALAPWIKECDWLMYQKMIRVVGALTLQVMPVRVVAFLKQISQKLAAHIKASFHSHPTHVVEAKLGPATIFASLLDRMLRVNQAAHAAADVLSKPNNRDAMYEEWVRHVEPLKIVQQELPNCGYQEVMHILTKEIRSLLAPANVAPEIETMVNQNGGASFEPTQEVSAGDSSTQGVLDRWTNFIMSLPERFPRTDARTIINYMNAVASACLRDITMNCGSSFGAWWMTKIWLDEMIAWLAEKGGFMEHTAPTSHAGVISAAADSIADPLLDCINSNNDHINGTTKLAGSRSDVSTSHHDDSRFSSLEAGTFSQALAEGNSNSNGNAQPLAVAHSTVPQFDSVSHDGGSAFGDVAAARHHDQAQAQRQAHADLDAAFGRDFVTHAHPDDSGIGGMQENDGELAAMGKFAAFDGVSDARIAGAAGAEAAAAAGPDSGDVVVC